MCKALCIFFSTQIRILTTQGDQTKNRLIAEYNWKEYTFKRWYDENGRFIMLGEIN